MISWIPSEDAAKAFLQMRDSEEPVLHLAHPKPVPWKIVIEPLAASLRVPLVPFENWFAQLVASTTDLRHTEDVDIRRYPALRLLDFFRSVEIRGDKEPLGIARLEVQKAVVAAPVLSATAQLTSNWACKWLDSWRTVGLLESAVARTE